MGDTENIRRRNQRLAERLSLFLNLRPDFIEESIIRELCGECGLCEEDAFCYVLSSAIGLDTEQNGDDRIIFRDYFGEMVHMLSPEPFRENSYFKNIKIPEKMSGGWSLKTERYKPYEAFVCDDLKKCADGRIVPQIGFFKEEFSYPAVLENGREWMLITPNEIQTMSGAVAAARGRVLTYGLGLGYFAYMASEKKSVISVCVVERDENAIRLFSENILPQFPCGDKVKIVRSDAFEFAKKRAAGQFDFVFCDLWHDPSDGVSMYKKMKRYEDGNAEYMYWIEKTIECYL